MQRSLATYAALITGVTITALGIDHGGTGRGAWGLAALAFGAAGAAILVGWVRPTRTTVVWIAMLAALTAWTGLSAIWSPSPSVALVEANRTLLYLGVGVLVAFAPIPSLRWVPHAVLVATALVCLDCLALRAFPGFPGNAPFLGYGRLYQPVGYWNALGILAALGSLIALQVAASAAQPKAWRVAASTSLPIMLPVMYLTFSRGAALAFCAGAVVSLLAARRRIDWTVCAVANLVAPGLVIVITSRVPGLVSGDTTDSQTGGLLIAAVVLGIATAVPIAMALDARPAALRTFRTPRRITVAIVAGAAVICALGLVATVGSPATAAHRAAAEFRKEVWFTRDLNSNLNNRYTELSLSGRVQLWDGALQLATHHPLLGDGAGTFGAYWESLDRYPHNNNEALSLYLETAAELGVIGLVILLGVLLLPLWNAVRARPHADLVLGAFAAFLVHAAQDMDWEWPVVSVTGIVCAALLVRHSSSAARVVPVSPAIRWVAGGACVLLAAISLTAAAVATHTV